VRFAKPCLAKKIQRKTGTKHLYSTIAMLLKTQKNADFKKAAAKLNFLH